MKMIRLGILGASEIAYRRFFPALSQYPQIEYAGVASRSFEKAQHFGGQIYSSYEDLLNDRSIDAVYIPLPPSLHYEWAKKALSLGKHVLLEKPFTTKLINTEELISMAQKNHLALHENYMFIFHRQLSSLQQLLKENIIGEVREYRIDFGFPKRAEDDFRYNKSLGGGALLDCGGYPIKLALYLLGNSAKLSYSSLKYPEGYEIDLYGTAILENNNGAIAKVSFGMDNAYKCDIEIWGSLGTIKTDRIFTALDNFSPKIIIKKGNNEQIITIEPDDQFYHSIDHFYSCIYNTAIQQQNFEQIRQQSSIIEQILYQQNL